MIYCNHCDADSEHFTIVRPEAMAACALEVAELHPNLYWSAVIGKYANCLYLEITQNQIELYIFFNGNIIQLSELCVPVYVYYRKMGAQLELKPWIPELIKTIYLLPFDFPRLLRWFAPLLSLQKI